MDLISVSEQISKIAAVQMHDFPSVPTEGGNTESATETSLRVLKGFQAIIWHWCSRAAQANTGCVRPVTLAASGRLETICLILSAFP